MSKRTAADLLPARFTPNPLALADMKVATLKMPYVPALLRFSNWLEGYFKEQKATDDYGKTLSPKPPHRLLNSALVSCAPTLAHAFEWYQGKNRDGVWEQGQRMLVVAKPDKPLVYPATQQIADVMRQWIRVWHDKSPWLQQAAATPNGKNAWETLLAALDADPDTKWRTDYDLREILTNTNQEGGLAFDLMPNLLATLLHETESIINGKTVRWRRMQEGGPHLCLLSDPLSVQVARVRTQKDAEGRYEKKSVTYDAHFCYKVEIRLHNQAGRHDPWIYFKTHCTRIASLPLLSNKRGNELTLLVGNNETRLTGWATDTTLVRLKASKKPKDSIWLDDLPELLARIGARKLEEPKDICAAPSTFWHKQVNSLPKDQYFVIHTEGYKYKGASTHPVMAGLPLLEQAEIIGQLTSGVLKNVLLPDGAIAPDSFRIDPKNKPVILRNIEEIRKFHGVMTEAERKRANITTDEARRLRNEYWQPFLREAITRATRGKRLVIACFYTSNQTLEWIERSLWTNSLLVSNGGVKPGEVVFVPIPLPANMTDLVKPCSKKEDGKAKKAEETTAWRTDLRSRWNDYLQTTLARYLADDSVLVSAIVELDASHDPEKNILGRESAHSVIREIFARHNVRVQMTRPIRKGSGHAQFDAGQTGKSLNVVQEVITRQIGAVFASPEPLYQSIGLDGFGDTISDRLDVVAFSFRSSQSGVRYCVATRLRADGTVDVMLPGKEHLGCWMPYAEAFTKLGTIFAEARKYVRYGELGDPRYQGDTPCPLRLLPWEAAGFVEAVLTKHLDKPTVAIVEAENWRQSKIGNGGWSQLANPALAKNRDVLRFLYGKETKTHLRADVPHLLGVVRLRTDDETPGYATNRADWQFDASPPMPNYVDRTGFVDDRPYLFHYFSVNGVALTNKKQPQHGGTAKPVRYRNAGSEHAFKHAPLIEMVPFFVAPSYYTPEGLKALCRVPHYLRFHPGWGMGEVNSAYLMHLGDALIEDQETILGT